MSKSYKEILKKADKYFKEKNYVAAINTVNTIEDKPKEVLDYKYNLLFKTAEVCEKVGDILSLMYCLREMQKIRPENEEIILQYALCLEKINDFPNALLCYEQILLLNKKNYDALIHIALLFIKVENYESALKYIEKAKRIKPNQYKTAYAYFLIYEKSGSYDKALRYARKTVKLNPGFDEFYNCANAYYNACNYKKSLEYCDKALEQKFDDNIACLRKNCLKKLGKEKN